MAFLMVTLQEKHFVPVRAEALPVAVGGLCESFGVLPYLAGEYLGHPCRDHHVFRSGVFFGHGRTRERTMRKPRFDALRPGGNV